MNSTATQSLHNALKLHHSGELDRAERIYREILRVDPQHADALHYLGVTFHQRNENEKAVETIRRAIAVNRNVSQYHCNLGIACHALDRFDDAISGFMESLRIDPDNAKTHFNLGKTFESAGKISEAEKQFRQAVQLQPDFVESRFNLANALHDLGRMEESVAEYWEAINLSPRTAEIHNNLGTVYKHRDEYDQAMKCFQHAVDLNPDHAQSHNNLGTVYQSQGRYDQAIACYQRAVDIDPNFAGALTNLGNVFCELGQMDRAIDSFSEAIRCQSDYAEAHFNRALARIQNREFVAGWEEYEWRWHHKVQPRTFPQPVWDGASLKAKTVLVYAEQGAGDEIMFASCVPDMIACAQHVVLECDPRFVALFARSFPEATVIARPPESQQVSDSSAVQNAAVQNAVVQIALGSVPCFKRLSLEQFPRRVRYLIPDSHHVAKWRERYEGLGGELKVGISWRGGKEPNVRRIRSTTLDQWTDLLNIPDVRFINLQYGETQQELINIQKQFGITIHDWIDSDPRNDLDDFAAQITALDLVISVDNSTVHMAGAVGTEVWTLLPFSADWRWMRDPDESPWYPSMRLFRQRNFNDWNTTFRLVSSELRFKIRNYRKTPVGTFPDKVN
ncbi:MAG: glycosyltransferase family protein [Planctomycetes bacterium]|nr:glycosyltransferase family protein [Planctomycetota bacterium]